MPFRALHDRERLSFSLNSPFAPCGDQPAAIAELDSNLNAGVAFQTLLGITGSGKTFTIANVLAKQNRPALVIAPNKTLAAQLYSEFREFFPENKVRFFVSYYDYYQPEAYLPSTDTYIEKDAAINDEIDKLRHSATKALLEATDCIIVASVSCIYGLGAPEEYFRMMFFAEQGDSMPRDQVLAKLVLMQYQRSDLEFTRGTFRVRGETIDIFPSDQDAVAVRLLFFGDEIEEIRQIDSITGRTLQRLSRCAIYPVSHFVTDRTAINRAAVTIRRELQQRLRQLQKAGKLLEAQRLEQRTLYDIELLKEIGFCPGIENYSRHIDGRAAGTPPSTLIDYFPEDFVLIIDESHVTIPQINGMYRGDQSRKQNLVDFGFRLPSALDNRPLNFEEFWQRVGQAIFVSATPGDWELQQSKDFVVQQLNRPTGLLDPEVIIRPARNQVDDLIEEVKATVEQNERVLVTTLTKRMAEDLADYFRRLGIKCRYLHSDIDALERVEILRALRRGDFDVLIGINLLREGLDLVEVSLVAILDADKEGFLRSTRSLIQTMGRAARNINGRAILYADQETRSIKEAVSETERRRHIQRCYNQQHGIVPRSASSKLHQTVEQIEEHFNIEGMVAEAQPEYTIPSDPAQQKSLLSSLRQEMFQAASKQEYERAAQLRDQINAIQDLLLKL